MRVLRLVFATLAIGVASISSAQARDSFSIGINVGGYGYAPPAVYYAPPPVYYAPAPAYYYEPVRSYYHAPVVSYQYFGGGNYYNGHHARHHDGGRGWGHRDGHRGRGHGRHNDRGWR